MKHELAHSIYESLPVSLQNVACTLVGYRHRWTRYRRPFPEIVDELMESQWSSRGALRELQGARFRELCRTAVETVPHYRELDVDPDSSLHDFPVLPKERVRSDPRSFLGDRYSRWRLHRGRTSGTTGTALRLWFERRALVEEFATVWRLRRNVGVERGMRNLTFAGRSVVPRDQREPPFWRYNRAENQVVFSQYHTRPGNLAYYAEEIRRQEPPYYVQGYPSFVHLLAAYLLEEGITVPRPVAIFTSSESLLAWQRDRIEEAFDAPLRDRYGVGEFCVSMTECEAGRLHVDEEFGIVELKEVLEETDEMETGVLLCTGLANRAMPLIRYEVGDVGTRYRSPCSCGRESSSFEDIDGRLEDYVVTPEGDLVGRLDHVFKDLHRIREAQIVQHDRSSVDVRVVAADGFAEEDHERLQEELRTRLGSSIEIRVHYVDEIPRTDRGKLRAVVSEVVDARDPLAAV